MACLPGGGGRRIHRTNARSPSEKDPTGPAGLRRSLSTTKGKTVNFTMSKHYESCTNATGSENGEPGRLNRAYSRGDMAVRSIGGKTGLSGERSLDSSFGSGE